MSLMDIFKVKQFKQEIQELHKKMDESGITEYYQAKEECDKIRSNAIKEANKIKEDAQSEASDTRRQSQDEIKNLHIEIYDLESNRDNLISNRDNLQNEINSLSEEFEKINKSVATQSRKVAKIKELYKSIHYTVENFFQTHQYDSSFILRENDLSELESISPSVILKLHARDVKDLRKAYRENSKLIDKALSQYSSRYNTKANKAIYQLMVIALRAELQNVLYNLKYEKLDTSVEDIKKITDKYLKIATDGNQSIAGTMTKFIGEIEYLFINAVKIEYNYYVKKEQAKQEQLAIRQQMREEAEERKRLEEERKKIEKEEEKYSVELERIKTLLESTQDEAKIAEYQAHLIDVEAQLANVAIQKEEVSKLQNGRAGYVYVISNLGSFGENMFKIGMTRHLNPQDRIDELGSASVPFLFDVHSFIFSEDAVGLENKLHEALNDNRVNRVNMRKEFFYSTVDALEELVEEIDPTAEFSKTMIAEEFRQSQSGDGLYTSDYEMEDLDDEEDA